ncbi:MAG: hypothetical protein QQN41_13115 [Nitrosopumilus sp.]
MVSSAQERVGDAGVPYKIFKEKMINTRNPVQNVIDEEIRRRESILEKMHKKIYTRVVELKLMPGEVVSQIKRVDGVLVEFERKI